MAVDDKLIRSTFLKPDKKRGNKCLNCNKEKRCKKHQGQRIASSIETEYTRASHYLLKT